jgi:LemA protein
MSTLLTILFAIAGLIILWLIYTFNRLVRLNARAEEALSDIDVQTKRRYDLIPNLVRTVKGYMQHEKSVLENVTRARTEAMSASGDPIQRSEKENALSNTLKTLFAVAESYPNLKANANFLDLQRELADTENKIQASRRFYNSTIKDLNIKIDSFPTRFVAQPFGFSKKRFFELTNAVQKEPIEVKF